jgi:hypothetical protein
MEMGDGPQVGFGCSTGCFPEVGVANAPTRNVEKVTLTFWGREDGFSGAKGREKAVGFGKKLSARKGEPSMEIAR